MHITVDQFRQLFGEIGGIGEVVAALNEQLSKFEINTKDRVCAFLAQAGVESGGFKARVENLNYSAQGLRKVFPKYFPDDATAAKYARQPTAIANKVYGGRMGNGPEATGEGFKFRGRGYIQLTGKDNYLKCGRAIGIDLIAMPDYLVSTTGALQSAMWYWSANNLNSIADTKDMKVLTKRINGGYHGLEERIALYEKAQSIL